MEYSFGFTLMIDPSLHLNTDTHMQLLLTGFYLEINISGWDYHPY
jgi:hypothetical protein